ncbi:amidohydrolase, partial [Staphylococcus gallinarum]
MLNYNDIVNWRRMFHQYPELSNDEFETTKRIRRILQQYDIRIL